MGNNEWLDIDVLEDYLDGKLDSKTMYTIERLSLEDPFVAEALAGLSQSPKRTHHLSLLQKQLQERVAQKPIEEKRWRLTSHRLSIAATAAVLFITVSILFWMKESKRQEVAKAPKKVEVQIAPEVAKQAVKAKDSVVAQPPAATKPIAAPQTTQKAKARGNVGAKSPDQMVAAVVTTKTVEKDKAFLFDSTQAVAKAKQARTNDNDVFKVIAENENSKKKAEIARTVALPNKAPGIFVESNVPKSQGPPVTINGKVFGKNDGLPLPGATVKLTGTNKATTTNKDGEFSLKADTNAARSLSIGYLGFATKEVKANANETVNVSLEPSNAKLSEVIVAAIKEDKVAVKTVSRIGGRSATASPVGGWDRFEAYLSANQKLAKEADGVKYVTLSFEVRKDGRVKNIKVINGLSKTENEEAIRLLKDGPNWISKNGATQATLSIKF